MTEQANKTSICSIVALDLIDYAKKPRAEKLEIKRLFNTFIQNAVLDIPEADRNMIDTAGGAVIAFKGPLEDALEDALFVSITIRDEILKHNQLNATPLYVQFGIHFGASRVVNAHIVGQGIDEAQRIMQFASPNQILVSNVYFDMASKVTQEIAQMFDKYEMHAHDHDVYAVRLLKETAPETLTDIPDDIADVAAATTGFNWTYAFLGLLTAAALFMLAKVVLKPTEPTITIVQPNIQPAPVITAPTEIKVETPIAAEQTVVPEKEEVVVETQAKTKTVNKTEKEPAKQTKPVQKAIQKPVQQKPAPEKKVADSVKAKSEKPADEKPTSKQTETSADKTKQVAKDSKETGKETNKEKSGWQVFKDSVTTGTDRKCTQAEVALNQCAK